MPEQLRLGLIGLGPRGRNGWLSSIPLVECACLVAVCDRHPAALERAATDAGLGERDRYQDVDQLLAREDIDAVVIAVAPEDQPDIAVKALESGKHALCEVPLCYTLADCWRLVTTAERCGRTLALGEQVCQSGFAQAWHDLIVDGSLGTITFAEAEYLHGIPDDWYWIDSRTAEPLPWNEAAGNPHAQKTRFWTLKHPAWYNPHSLSPLLYALDERVITVTCVSTGAPSRVRDTLPVADLEVALATTHTGTIIRIATGFVAPTPHPWHWYRLMGTAGDVETSRRSHKGVPDGSGLLWLASGDSAARSDICWDGADRRNYDRAAASGHNGLDYFAVEDFVEAVLQGRRPRVDVYRAAEIAAAGILAGMSADDGGAPKTVPDFRPGTARLLGQAPSPG
jgi:predicted dehydrogenase